MGNYVFYGTEDLISEQPIDLKDYLLETYLEKQLKSVSFAVKQQPCLSPSWGQKENQYTVLRDNLKHTDLAIVLLFSCANPCTVV